MQVGNKEVCIKDTCLLHAPAETSRTSVLDYARSVLITTGRRSNYRKQAYTQININSTPNRGKTV